MPEGGHPIAHHALAPRVSVGRDHLLVAYTTSDRALIRDEGMCGLPGSALVVPLPLGSAPPRELVPPVAGDCPIDIVNVMQVARLGDDPALLRCILHEDCSTDPSAHPECWFCDLHVPARPTSSAHFALPPGTMSYDPVFAFAGRTLFGAVPLSEGAAPARAVAGFVVRHGRVQRGLALSVRPELQGGNTSFLSVHPLSEERALVEWTPPDASGTRPDESRPRQRIILLDTGGRADARDAAMPAPPPLAVETFRGPPYGAPPRLRVLVDGVESFVAGMPTASARFAPTLVTHRGRRFLVYSEGLRARTRIRMVELDTTRPETLGEPLTISGPTNEANEASVDVFGERAFVTWSERRDRAWELLAAELRCE